MTKNKMKEYIVGKGEKCWLPEFSSFSHKFSTGFFYVVVKRVIKRVLVFFSEWQNFGSNQIEGVCKRHVKYYSNNAGF